MLGASHPVSIPAFEQGLKASACALADAFLSCAPKPSAVYNSALDRRSATEQMKSSVP